MKIWKSSLGLNWLESTQDFPKTVFCVWNRCDIYIIIYLFVQFNFQYLNCIILNTISFWTKSNQIKSVNVAPQWTRVDWTAAVGGLICSSESFLFRGEKDFRWQIFGGELRLGTTQWWGVMNEEKYRISLLIFASNCTWIWIIWQRPKMVKKGKPVKAWKGLKWREPWKWKSIWHFVFYLFIYHLNSINVFYLIVYCFLLPLYLY